ncbi:MAG: S41 family peptidase [Rubrivivax sp.]
MATNRSRVLPALAALLLAACGGGGGGDTGNGAGTGLVAADSVAGLCRFPRPASVLDAGGRPYPDRPGTLKDERDWVRSWIDETYLWYRDVRALPSSTLDASRYASPVDYFDALRSHALTPSGNARDRFHFTEDTAAWVALSGNGTSVGYGMVVTVPSPYPPREVRVAAVQAGSAAALAGLVRGTKLLTADGVNIVDTVSSSDIDVLNEALFPTRAAAHAFTVQDPGPGAVRTVTLAAVPETTNPLPQAFVLPAPNQDVGYLRLDDHLGPAESALVPAITALRDQGITDLVLDLRYNGGGYVAIASELAYMIAGPARTAGRVFEEVQANDRNPFGWTDTDRRLPFLDRTQGFSLPSGAPLPTLGLDRVYVLAGADTCSASEAVVNGLRGVGVQVVLVGGRTCGKPYGFFPTDNCSVTYFAIQFQGVNALGFGDYADGFEPQCPVADDFGHALGDPAEARLAVALDHRRTGACAGIAAQQQVQSWHVPTGPALQRPPLRSNRFYRGRAQPSGAFHGS